MIPLFITLTTRAGRPVDINIQSIALMVELDSGTTSIKFRDDRGEGEYKEPLTTVRALINEQTQELLDQLAVTIRGH